MKKYLLYTFILATGIQARAAETFTVALIQRLKQTVPQLNVTYAGPKFTCEGLRVLENGSGIYLQMNAEQGDHARVSIPISEDTLVDRFPDTPNKYTVFIGDTVNNKKTRVHLTFEKRSEKDFLILKEDTNDFYAECSLSEIQEVATKDYTTKCETIGNPDALHPNSAQYKMEMDKTGLTALLSDAQGNLVTTSTVKSALINPAASGSFQFGLFTLPTLFSGSVSFSSFTAKRVIGDSTWKGSAMINNLNYPIKCSTVSADL